MRGRGAKARDYLAAPRPRPGRRRSTFASAMRQPEKFALRDHLAAKGVAAEDMVEAGL